MQQQPSNYSQYSQSSPMYTMCQKMLYYYVQVQTSDGAVLQGIPVEVDSNNMMMLVPEEVDLEADGEQMEMPQGSRQFGYGVGRPRRRGFYYRRRRFPLAGLAALSVVPFLFGPYGFGYGGYGYPYYY